MDLAGCRRQVVGLHTPRFTPKLASFRERSSSTAMEGKGNDHERNRGKWLHWMGPPHGLVHHGPPNRNTCSDWSNRLLDLLGINGSI